jgi:hypothetical protein
VRPTITAMCATNTPQIKWQDKAHYHSTWEDYSIAKNRKGFRKVDNYFKGPVTTDISAHFRRKLEPEEFEQHMVARESERESQRDFHVVERVIDSQDGEEETEYYVKCKCPLPTCSVHNLIGTREGLDVRILYLGTRLPCE